MKAVIVLLNSKFLNSLKKLFSIEKKKFISLTAKQYFFKLVSKQTNKYYFRLLETKFNFSL